MYIESIRFKRTIKSEWEKGYYIGDTDNSDKCCFLDINYKPIKRYEQCDLDLWSYETDLEDWLQVRIPIQSELE
ncbi:hypothetical protein FC831_13955 [Clostridium botulinum]|nr:hypothetical protein [Clostridium botulinum]